MRGVPSRGRGRKQNMKLRNVRIEVRLAAGIGVVLAMFVFVVIVGNIVTAKSSTELTQGLELANKKRALAATMNNAARECYRDA